MCVDSFESLTKEKIMLNKFAVLIMLAGFAVGLAGCNTVEGAGKDIKAGGEKIEKAADKAKKE
jgi:entericidin B